MAEEKKGMFGAAKAKPAAKSKKDDKEAVVVPGLEQKLKDLQEFKAQIADLEALVSGISDELKVLGKEKFIELYLRDKTNPNTFLIKDGEGCIMFLPMDKYIGVKDEERSDKLKAEYGDVVTKDERYYFNGAVLERNQDTIEKLLMGSPDITDSDKENLLVKEVKFSIKKGTIDGLLKYGDKISTVIDDIQPIFQIKNCGGAMADGGSVFTEEEDIIYDTRADDYYFKNKNSDLEAAIAKWEAEEADKYMSGGGSIIRANNSPILKYANFEDNWHINLLELNPYRNNSGLRYKGGNKYGVTRVSPKSGQEVFEFKTLEDAENKFNKLVELSKTFSPIRFEGKTPRYPHSGGGSPIEKYAKGGGGVEAVKEDYSHKVGDRITDGTGRSGDIVEVKNNGTRVVKINYANGPIKPELINVDEDDIEYWTVLYAAVIYEVYIDRGNNSGTETIADFENKKDAVNFIYEYSLKHPKAKLGIDTITSDYTNKYAKGSTVKGKDFSGNYFSTNDFVGANKLEKQAEKILGKGWEAEDDVSQIESIINSLGGEYVVTVPEDRSQWNEMREQYDLANPTNDSNYDIFVISESDFKYAGGGIGENFKKFENDFSSTRKGGVKNYSVDIDLENGEQLRGGDLDFKDGNDALFLYERIKKKGEYKNEKIEDIQLIANFKNGDYESVDIPRYAGGGGLNSFQSLLKKYNG